MNPFDQDPSQQPDNAPGPENTSTAGWSSAPAERLGGDPFSSASPSPALPLQPEPGYPEDLQISWSWVHFIVLLFFGIVSLVMIQGGLAVHYLPAHKKLTPQQMESFLLSKPQFAIGSMLIWYAAIFFFLYVTLSVLRGHLFWQCLGWRKIIQKNPGQPRNPLIYLFAGCALSIFVAILTSRLKAPENLPVEELFKFRNTALLFMAMAVLVAPLVEETLFRGYLYPLFARSFGVAPGILLTGVLFGFMHGAQLGWTWSLVATLSFVGIVFTFVRARTGSVFASYLMHLGYNSLIAVAAIVSTHGFTKMPPGH